MEHNKKYGLFTAITMIIGIVIGSGIFFKADDVLKYTNGNVLVGILIFLIAAIAIIFGSLSISQLATRTDNPGGIISYAEEFVNKETAASFGWFSIFLYLPAIIAVVSWVAGTFICQLFNIQEGVLNPYTIGVIVIVICYLINTLSAKFGGYFQNAAMIIKLIPLVLFAVFGLLKGNPQGVLTADMESIKTTGVSLGILSAFGPIAFSFDGWIVSTSICHEIKNSKRNLPIALVISPIVILLAYVFYFFGLSIFVGPEKVLELGNNSVNEMANILFGPTGAKVMLVFVIISVLGTVNGVILGMIRMPYSLAIRNSIPFSKQLSKQSDKLNGMPLNSAIFSLIITFVMYFIHYVTQQKGMPGDVSEISICISYLNYCILYAVIIKLAIKGEIKSKFMGYFVPIMATIGSLIILSGGFSNPLFPIYFAICLITMLAGYFYYKLNNK
ncbi:APC family permease [uncultured Tyzzerella sp.]|uniref:APC family permease n=1 Tax=uncultured Tyzzerella sp. TaxID=2321398 RepID=UPI00294253E9|nr:APC family permease [uncultured Tyzzerella sp.]